MLLLSILYRSANGKRYIQSSWSSQISSTMLARSARLIFFWKGMYGPFVDTIISLIISHTYIVSSFGLYTSGAFEGYGFVDLRHFSLSSYHFISCSIVFKISIQTQVVEMDEEVEIQMGDYVFTEKYCIGQGSYGKVYRGRNIRMGREVAIKEMDNQLITEQEISREIAILKQLKHPHIVEYEDAFQNGGYFYIVTEYCNGGDLRNLLDSDDEGSQDKQKKILQMFWQVCEGFNYLRKFDIIHRDLKPSNILIHNGQYKIADFGLAKRQSVHKSVINQELMGVPVYMSPQILSKNYYTFKCDVWSMGIIIFEMLFDYLPWKAQDVETLFFQIMNHPTPFSQVKEPHSQIFDIIFEKTLAYLEKERASWDQLLTIRQTKSLPRKRSSSKKPNKLIQKLSLFLNRVHPSLHKDEVQILNHIYSQGKSLQTQLLSITNSQCLNSVLSTIQKMLLEGAEIRSMLRDCCFVFLKLVQNNLYLQLMEYSQLQESRDLLSFLQLVHDYIFSIEKKEKITTGNSESRSISEYAAAVISKISTLLQNDKNYNNQSHF